jgi:lysophospholipase L1-like esterase
MRAIGVVSADFLKRIAEPSSRFHSDYLAHRRGGITHRELIARLPHVALLGDSVSTNVYVSSAVSTFWRSRHCRGGNWFFDANRSSAGVHSVSKQLEELTPFVAMEYAGVGAMVDDERDRQNFFRRILGTRSFSRQIGELVEARRFPDLILIAIGHNNVDWTWRCPPAELTQPERRLQREAAAVREKFERQLRRLVESARNQRHRVAIMVFGLINFGAYFHGRAGAERRRMADSRLYPHLETTYKYLASFRPAYRNNVVRMALMVNDELRALVTKLRREFDRDSNLEIRYSDALANADLSRAELLHAIDGWHASVQGHDVLAAAAFEGLKPSLEFLGIDGRVTDPHEATASSCP